MHTHRTSYHILRDRLATQKGAAMMISVIFFLVISITIIAGITSPVVWEVRTAQAFDNSRQAYFLAEAGGEDVFYRLKNGMAVNSTEYVPIGNQTVTVNTVDVGTNEKDITAYGDLVNNTQRNVYLKLGTSVSGSAFSYGAQVGEGGLIMSNSSEVLGSGGSVGNVYSNGPIVGSGNPTITGDAIVASSLTEDLTASSTVCNTDNSVGVPATQDYAQSFVAGVSGSLTKISLYVKRVSTPLSRPIYITNNNGGMPDTTSLSSGTLDESIVGTGYGWIDVTFATPPTLTAGQTYWIVFDGLSNASKYWQWCSDSSGGYGGTALYSGNWTTGSWSPVTGDLDFRTYYGGSANGIDSVTVDGNAKADYITNSNVGGDAYYQSNIGGTTVSGTKHPNSPDPSPLSMPISDAVITDWKNTAISQGTINGTVSLSGIAATSTKGKINGNLILANSASVTITGILYVTGYVSLSNSSQIKCDVGFGSDSCILIADGYVNVANGATFAGSGASGSYLMVVTTNTCDGTSGTGCTTSNSAMHLGNGATGALFYAPYGQILITNGADVTSVIGYRLNLSGGTSITYQSGVASTNFSAGPGGSWTIKNWKEVQ